MALVVGVAYYKKNAASNITACSLLSYHQSIWHREPRVAVGSNRSIE